MARYQLLRPAPVKVFPKRFRRQAPAASGPPAVGVPPEEGEVEAGPESPDSPGSSSDEGGVSSSDESDSETEGEELPSPAKSGAPTGSPSTGAAPTAISGSLSSQTTIAIASQAPAQGDAGSPARPTISAESPSNVTTNPTNEPSTLSTTTISSRPSFTQVLTSKGNNAALPQITEVTSSTGRTQIPVITSSAVPRPITSLSGMPPGPAQSDTRNDESPQRSAQQQDAPLMTRTAAVAATVLGVLGALALVIGLVILFKHRKRKQRHYNQRLADDAFNPGNGGSLHIPETAHVEGGSSLFSRIGGGGGGGTGHLTQSSARSNTLFGPGAYERPETVSTERNNSRFPIAPAMPTPNPFADPPLNKAYDVLAGRPRSTTLTDRGSWVKNPFRNPESERFDPFGELKAKARMERVKHMEEARREAEREVVRGYEEKERMGLMPEGVPVRKGSGVTLEGVGVLDRSAGGTYY